MTKRQTRPGIHPQFNLGRFTSEEKKILNNLSTTLFLTSSGCDIRINAARYEYFLAKLPEGLAESFNLEREVVCVFSSYDRFEPRLLEVFNKAEEGLSRSRVESICRVLISRDDKAEESVKTILRSDPEQPVIVPFTYRELQSSDLSALVFNRFRKHFYSRDLFDFLSPLKSELFFFGRDQLVLDLIARHNSGEHSGLFGLRKSGKTSIVYAVERALDVSQGRYVSIDCESPSVHKLRWNELLLKLVTAYRDKIRSKVPIAGDARYDEKNAADSFEADITTVFSSKKRVLTLFIFDEIERITPGTASSEHWNKELDFIYFWQTLRAFFQRNPAVFTYMLVGTNPNSVEKTKINGHENPLYSSVPSIYIPSFTLDQTRDMTGTLAKYVGLNFDDLVFARLTEDYGGHPFLIRQACSYLNKHCPGERPLAVDKPLYKDLMKAFSRDASSYLEMIVEVLREFYLDEYQMLKFLALNDEEAFLELAKGDPTLTKHLLGYGLIQQNGNRYAFCIDILARYLAEEAKYERVNLSSDQRRSEVSERRNLLEMRLRIVLKNALRLAYGKNAQERALAAVPENRRKDLSKLDLESLLAREGSPLFFLDLINIITREWDKVQNIFEDDKPKILTMLQEVNSKGRPDAHAKLISDDDFSLLRVYFNRLESLLEPWMQ